MNAPTDEIKDARQWRLLLEVGQGSVSSLMMPLTGNHNIKLEDFILEQTVEDAENLASLEDAIYNHPGLLLDYNRVDILIDTPRFLTIPLMLEPGSTMAGDAFTQAFPTHTPGELHFSVVEPMEMSIAYDLPHRKANFLRRTFHNATINHVLTPLCRYFAAKFQGRGKGKTVVNFDNGRMDIIVLGHRAPMAVNSYRVTEPMDAVYYILALRQNLGLAVTDEIMISGDMAMRSAVSATLRRYVRYVLPAIFPSSMLMGSRLALSAPFPLITAPLTI